MADTYRFASSVLVWFGESGGYSGQAIELLSVLAVLPMAELRNINLLDILLADVVTTKFGASIIPKHWEALSHFFGRTWFTRIWVLQEIIMAKDTKAPCGLEKLHWDSLTKVSSFIVNSPMASFFVSKNPETSIEMCYGATPSVLAHMKDSIKMDGSWHLEFALGFSRRYSASDKHEMVYALLNLSNEPFLDPQFGSSAFNQISR